MQCSGLVVSGTAMTIYLGTLRPLLPNSCFQPSLSLHSIVQTCIRSPTWIWGRYLLEKLTPLNLFPVKNQESFFNYVALECCIFYQTEQTLFLSFKLVCKLTNSGFKKNKKLLNIKLACCLQSLRNLRTLDPGNQLVAWIFFRFIV